MTAARATNVFGGKAHQRSNEKHGDMMDADANLFKTNRAGVMKVNKFRTEDWIGLFQIFAFRSFVPPPSASKCRYSTSSSTSGRHILHQTSNTPTVHERRQD